MRNDFDLVIVGAGIGGAALATRLSRAGVSVLMLERTLEHTDRIRGELLVLWGQQHVAEIGILPELLKAGGHYVPRFVDYCETTSIEDARKAPFDVSNVIPGIPGIMSVGHPAACNALDQAAEASGTRFLRGVEDVLVQPGDPPTVSFSVAGEKHMLRPRLVVGADGRSSTVARQIGARRHTEPVHHLVGGLLMDEIPDWPDDELATGVHGDNYLLVFPQAHERLRLYLCCSTADADNYRGPNAAKNFLKTFDVPTLPHGKAIVAGRIAGPCLGYPNANVIVDPIVADGVVLIGDAAGHTDPTIGQGLSVAFADVSMLCDVMLSTPDWGDLEPYVGERNQRMQRLRIVANIHAKLKCEWGESARAFRAKVEERVAKDPQAGNIRDVPVFGPYWFEHDTYGEAGVQRLFGDGWTITETGALRLAS